MINFGLSRLEKPLLELHPEIQARLWLELSSNHPKVLKIKELTVEIPQKPITHPDSYKVPVNKKTGSPYPNCCTFHETILKDVGEWFEIFPNCCSGHQKLKDVQWFSVNRYSGVAEKVARQVVFTEYHILEFIDSANWFEETAHYIEANIDSFGKLPNGLGNPIGLEHYFKYLTLALTRSGSCLKTSGICEEKINRLLFFLNVSHPDSKVKNKSILDLFSVYQKWLRTFPFDTSYFRNSYNTFKNLVPFEYLPVYGKLRDHQRLKRQVRLICSDSELLEFLVKLTKRLLLKVNAKVLIEKGRSLNLKKLKLEVVSEKHRIGNAELIEEFSGKEIEYVEILKRWLANEIEYLEGIEGAETLINPQSQELGNSQALQKGIKADILEKENELSSATELFKVEKAIINGLSSNKKFYEGYARKVTKRQFALCYLVLKELGIIQDDVLYGREYKKSFEKDGEMQINDDSPKNHEIVYGSVKKLLRGEKRISRNDKLDLEKVKRVFRSYPGVQKFIDGILEDNK